jgi:hypothetical protein
VAGFTIFATGVGDLNMKAKLKNRELKAAWQLRCMFGLAKPLAEAAGMESDEYLRALARHVTRRDLGLRELYFDEASEIISELKRIAKRTGRVVPLRTDQWRRKKAGVKKIETQDHLALIEDLRLKLGYSKEYVEGISLRANKRAIPITTEQGNRVIETLKQHLRSKGKAAA